MHNEVNGKEPQALRAANAANTANGVAPGAASPGVTGRRIFSGIQPSGDIHLGNWLGAIKNWVALQDEYECVYCVVDYHAITVPCQAEDLARRIENACIDLLACGIDPEKSKLIVQSHVPQHTELAWILACYTSLGDLERMTQFKDKAEQHAQYISAGLFTYPILQAADIAIYRAHAVPVGEDQLQHLELAREIVRRFNGRTGRDVLPEAAAIVRAGARVPGLDGAGKMSKSKNNYIGIMEGKDEIWKKLAPAKTDEKRRRKSDPGNPDDCTLWAYHTLFTESPEELDWVQKGCRYAGIGCVECKRCLLENIDKALLPIRERRREFAADPARVGAILRESAAWCREEAEATMREVRQALGVR